MAYLELIGPGDRRSVYSLESETVSIGRSGSSDVVLPDPTVSRHQARLSRRRSEWYLEDVGSRNGTAVNRVRIANPVRLRDGTEIRFGNSRAVFFDGDVRSLDSSFSGDTLGQAAGFQVSLDSIVQQFLMAREIQRFLLPRNNPSLDGYELFGESQPCYEVGGDFYDYVRRPDGALGVVLGDVARKGFGSAVLGHFTQATIRTAFDYELNLDRLATKLNREICSHTADNQFVSAIMGVIDPGSGVLTYVNAGHCLPLLVREDGTTRFLPGHNMLLGILESEEYSINRVELAVGDTCLLYSDGITEYRDTQDRMFGEQRLAQFLSTRRTMEPERIVRELESELEAFARGSQPADDLTLMLLRRVN